MRRAIAGVQQYLNTALQPLLYVQPTALSALPARLTASTCTAKLQYFYIGLLPLFLWNSSNRRGGPVNRLLIDTCYRFCAGKWEIAGSV